MEQSSSPSTANDRSVGQEMSAVLYTPMFHYLEPDPILSETNPLRSLNPISLSQAMFNFIFLFKPSLQVYG